MEFQDGSYKVILKGSSSVSFDPLQLQHIWRMIDGVACAALIQLELQTSTSSTTPHVAADLEAVLQSFATVFDIPHGLPPPCNQDHSIHLQSRTQPVNVQPY